MELQKKPTVKKNFSLEDFKKKINNEDIPNKPLEWFTLAPAVQEATGLPGVPKGYVTLFRGFSNTGKSTALCETIVSAQKKGVLPIIIDTENNLGRDRLKLMGFDWDNNFFVEIDNEYLLEYFGKKKNSKKEEASIEDLADCIHFFIDKQESGELPYDLLFAIDSFGTLDGDMTVNAKLNDTSTNNQWNAGAFERSFKSILNYRIPNSKKMNKPYTNTLCAVQKIWLEAQPIGQPIVKHKNGEASVFGSRLIFHIGGKKTQGVKFITAESKKKEISFAIETAIDVVKNQIDGPLGGISLNGRIVSTPHGFIGCLPEDIAKYKKENLAYFREKLGSDINENDINTKFDVDKLEDSDVKEIFNNL